VSSSNFDTQTTDLSGGPGFAKAQQDGSAIGEGRSLAYRRRASSCSRHEDRTPRQGPPKKNETLNTRGTIRGIAQRGVTMQKNGSSSTNVVGSPHVADYFCILGVGKDLVWKHQQKRNPHHPRYREEEHEEDDHDSGIIASGDSAGAGRAGNEDHDETETNDNEHRDGAAASRARVALHDSEDEMERFLREIVDVAIVCVRGDEDDDNAEDELHRGEDRGSLHHPRGEDERRGKHDSSKQSSSSSRTVDADRDEVMLLRSAYTSSSVLGEDDDDESSSDGDDSEIDHSNHGGMGRGALSASEVLDATNSSPDSLHRTRSSNERGEWTWVRQTPMLQGRCWTADLSWERGLPAQIQQIHPDGDLASRGGQPRFYLAYQRRKGLRRSNQEPKYYEPGVSHVELRYVRIHSQCCIAPARKSQGVRAEDSNPTKAQQPPTSMAFWTEQLKHRYSGQSHRAADPRDDNPRGSAQTEPEREWPVVRLEAYMQLPPGYHEWRIPQEFRHIYDPQRVSDALRRGPAPQPSSLVDRTAVRVEASSSAEEASQGVGGRRTYRTAGSGSGGGFETVILETLSSHEMISESLSGPTSHPSMSMDDTMNTSNTSLNKPKQSEKSEAAAPYPSKFLIPRLLHRSSRIPLPPQEQGTRSDKPPYLYVPVLAIRRQDVGDDERFHEDPAIAELSVSFYTSSHSATSPSDDPAMPRLALPAIDDDEDDEDMMMRERPDGASPLDLTDWCDSSFAPVASLRPTRDTSNAMSVALVARRNRPFGFADATFATSVLHRFPFSNYHDLPLPEEELPMFCYPTGCRLHRARLSEAPLPEYYGFVVKNERGDSIYVSCVSFMEPLVAGKVRQLDRMSWFRRETSLAHRMFCQRRRGKEMGGAVDAPRKSHSSGSMRVSSDVSTDIDSSFLMGFDDVTTFEKKTICLVSRYPCWTAFRKFLSHLHILSASTSELPLERYISHLLLTVPVPKPGGPSVIIPLPALNEPMILSMPSEKDLPLVDIPFQRLVSCLEVKTLVTVVIGLLALERKVIVMSTRPSLVLDVCELLRSLLFPFDLCAPYVPRLTEPFQSSLEFPGALFVGIHKDGSPRGLAETVMKTPPEDSILVDLDSGALDCDGERTDVIGKVWGLIPAKPRSMLVSELETLCRDAGIVDGQEPLDSQYDSAFDVNLPSAVEDFGVVSSSRDSFDDRAFRDAFLRFFCSVLGGYDRFLVVPDADFLVSGNEWFDAQGFLSSVSAERAPYLGSLVTTQLFQSFIQRRTEASDVHCLLFDECIAEFHSASLPYGRLGGDVEVIQSADPARPRPQMIYSLLVDQAALTSQVADHVTIAPNRSMDDSEADSSINLSKTSLSIADYSVRYGELTVTTNGDFITGPSHQDLQPGKRYVYTVDGNPCFPERLDPSLLLPSEPDSLFIEMVKQPNPLLFRSDRELDEADRMRRKATSYRSIQNQRRCLWQLPKLMGSHFLGAWLLCIPVQVSQKGIAPELQSRYLARSLGALRLMRSKQRIVPDEAAYRALMVACGRCVSDRRIELVKLFGLLRSDGIFPSAVTLGQYTRALAEGYSKRFSSSSMDDDVGLEVTESASRVGRLSVVSMGRRQQSDFETRMTLLDSHLSTLEDHGRRWRHRNGRLPGETRTDNKSKNASKAWLPVVYSTSFAPFSKDSDASFPKETPQRIRIHAIWSRTRQCNNCMYIPFDEEIQAGWDVVGGDHDIPGAIGCPRCGSLIVPMLGYRSMSLSEALEVESGVSDAASAMGADFASLPPQLRPFASDPERLDASYVAYISPATLRRSLEQYVEEYGQEALDRETLREHDPELFVNFWWYCARFSLPLPLSVPATDRSGNPSFHDCAVAAWDRSSAERGCLSAGRVFTAFFDSVTRAPSDDSTEPEPSLEWLDDQPLLSRFNLQAFHSSVWEHVDLFAILVKLVEACDKRDFKPVGTINFTSVLAVTS
jgi:DENN (AEX-3) domain/uDENN domain/dDENN domain